MNVFKTFIFDIQHPTESLLDQLENQANPVKISGDYTEWSDTINQISQIYNIFLLSVEIIYLELIVKQADNI